MSNPNTSLFVERVQIVQAFSPIDLAAGANTGDWVSLEKFGGCACVVFKAAGTAGDDPTFTIQQASDNAGTGAKALTFTRIDSKENADITGVGTFTTTTQTASEDYTNATLAEAEAIIVIDIQADMLDTANGFTHINLSCDDPGSNAQIGGGLYMLYGPRYSDSPLPSAL